MVTVKPNTMTEAEQIEALKTHQGERRICCFNGLPASGMWRYHFGARESYEAGITEHPQVAIRKLAPDAHNFEPQSLFDCWLFDAPEIADLPPYVWLHGGKP